MAVTSQDVIGVVCSLINMGVMFGILTAYAKAGIWMDKRPWVKMKHGRAFDTLVIGTGLLAIVMGVVLLLTTLTLFGVLPKYTYLYITVGSAMTSLIAMRLHVWVVRLCRSDLE